MQAAVRRRQAELQPALEHRRPGVPSKPPMSWLQKPKPESASESPPRSVSAIDSKVDMLSPPQWTGKRCPPAVAERAKTTAPGSPLASLSTSKTAAL